MNYEKAYKEALERAKEFQKSKDGLCVLTAESIFPELQESEDERIRKVLIDYFNRYKEQEECGVKTFFGIPTDNIIAWLEKQGEQDFSHNVEDKIRNELYDFIYITTFKPKDLKKKERFLDWIEKQGQKPTWSGEDKKRIDRICDFVWKNRKGDTDEIYQQEQDVDWLKSLKERLS